jgi:CheY-like chemotaxis protein
MDYGKHYRWTYEQALAAIKLQQRGLSYTAIGIVLELYHDAPPMDGAMVCRRLRHRGVPARRQFTGRSNLPHLRAG